MIKSIFSIVVLPILFSGCISITKELPSYKTYTLSLLNSTKKNTKYLDKTIYIYEPKAISSLNTKAINYSKDSFEQEKYALSRWSDKPSKMLQQVIANYLISTKSYKFITTSNIKIDSNYRLISQIVDFKQTFTNKNSYADFSIRVYLINNKTEKVFFKSFTYNKKSNLNEAKGLVIALNEIKTNFLIDLNNFIFLSMSKDKYINKNKKNIKIKK